MPIPRFFAIGAMLLLVTMPLLSCTDNTPANLGISDSELTPCPKSPNCVSSDARDSKHNIPPLQLIVPPSEAFQVARELVLKLPRTRIVNETTDYLHAECRSALFGFVDDLELHLRPAEGIIAIRSAARLGYSDFGVNRRRVESLRDSLISQGVVQ
ncbi:MAG: DUF1499 domain-containing protein [Pseudomonadota bacterium]|nr:DUF1499 domain-containing protein [Pseudomonadota bacterium]